MTEDNYTVGCFDEKTGTFKKNFSVQGFVYINPKAFENKTAEVCYIPELCDNQYSYDDFMKIAHNNYALAAYLFETVNWQCPETLFDELVVDGEIDESGRFLL